LLDQAAGIVIDLLVALSLIALATASVLLAASARAEVERRLDAIGIRRALGAPRGHVTLTMTVEALLIALPPATLGPVAGGVATAVTLGCSAAFVLLMLALVSALSALETDPQALGKRYQLSADLPASAVRQVQAISGVESAAPRYEDQAVDSFSLGETIDVVG